MSNRVATNARGGKMTNTFYVKKYADPIIPMMEWEIIEIDQSGVHRHVRWISSIEDLAAYINAAVPELWV